MNLFRDKAEVTHRMNFDDLSDEELLLRVRDETEALLREKRAAGLLDNGGDEGCSRAGRRTCPMDRRWAKLRSDKKQTKHLDSRFPRKLVAVDTLNLW